MPGWDGFDIPGWVGSRLGIPVLVDNDVNLMALGERSMAWPQVDDLMFVKVSTGIGSGIISVGLLQRGAQVTAGDIGHIQISGDEVKACHCGNHGCLEANAAGPAVISSLQRSGVAVSSTTELIALVRQGNIDAIGAVREAGRKIGEVLAMSVSMINPSVIVLGGSMAQAGEHLIAGVREIVYLRSMPLASSHLAIVASRAAQQAGVIGAAIMALEHSLSAENIDAMLNQTELSK
jgi:glucokinase